jgi:hypothetical protein
VEEVGEHHPDAALLDLGRLRILGVIDETGPGDLRSVRPRLLSCHRDDDATAPGV